MSVEICNDYELDVVVCLRDFKNLVEDEEADLEDRSWARCVIDGFKAGALNRETFIKHARRLDDI